MELLLLKRIAVIAVLGLVLWAVREAVDSAHLNFRRPGGEPDREDRENRLLPLLLLGFLAFWSLGAMLWGSVYGTLEALVLIVLRALGLR